MGLQQKNQEGRKHGKSDQKEQDILDHNVVDQKQEEMCTLIKSVE